METFGRPDLYGGTNWAPRWGRARIEPVLREHGDGAGLGQDGLGHQRLQRGRGDEAARGAPGDLGGLTLMGPSGLSSSITAACQYGLIW